MAYTLSECLSKLRIFSILPLYQGPIVKIRIIPCNNEYTISKSLLCAESPVFSAMSKGEFLEARQLTVDIGEMEDVITVRSVEGLIQWLHLRVVNFGIDSEDLGEHISAAIELAKLADKYNIAGLEAVMAQHIKNIIIANPGSKAKSPVQSFRYGDANAHWLTFDHIVSAAVLPREHPVRRLIAAASVSGYLQSVEYKLFAEETQNCPSFGADLLREVRLTLNGTFFTRDSTAIYYNDPISGTKITSLGF